MSEQVEAPFTQQQVAGLRAWQDASWVHPFTCPNRGDGDHPGTAKLVPSKDGWFCRYCVYTQTWAHDFMVDGPPPDPFAP